MHSQTFPLEPALWFDTAVAPPPTVSLSDDISTDILVIGAGYAGLSTALHLAELGHKPVVLEAKTIGFGGSGRNGGQLVPGLKWDPDELKERLNGSAGEKLVEFAGNTAKDVFDIIDKYQLDVPLTRKGWLQPAHNQEGMKLAEKRFRQWKATGADVELLSAADMTRLLGTNKYHGGWLDKRGGGLQPLSYARELARAAINAGATIYTDTPVDHLSKTPQGWVAQTASGLKVAAKTVVLCTNAYSKDLVPRLSKSIIAANTYQVATEALPKEIADSILPDGHVASDTKNLLFYFRKDHTGRFMMGGRGPFREPRTQADWDHLKRAAVKMFPALTGAKWNYHWCGRVAITRDYFPHLHEPAPGLIIDLGCMGRGVGLQTSMGRALARYVHTGDTGELPLPISRIKPLPLYPLRKIYVGAVVAWYRMTDGGMA